MSTKILLLIAVLIPLALLIMDLQMARQYYRRDHGMKGWSAVSKWFKRRRLVVGGLAVIFAVSAGVLLFTNLPRHLGPRHESKQYMDSAVKYLKEKKYNEAVIELRNVVKNNPEDTEAYLLLARALARLGQGKEALESYRKVLDLDAKQYDAHLESGRLAFALKELPLAQAEASEAARLRPDKPEPRLLLARIHQVAGNHDQAIAECRHLLGKYPANKEARYFVISSFMQMRSFAAAQQEAEAGLAHAPEDARLRVMLAKALVGMGRLAEAESALQIAATKDLSSSDAYVTLAEVQIMKGESQTAIKSYDEALKRSPNNDLIMNNIASLIAEHGGDLERAAQLGARMYAKHPNDPAVADTLGWTLYRQGKTKEALPLLNQAVSRMPHDPLHRYHLGAALMASGNRSAGRKELEAALKISSRFSGSAHARELLTGKTRL